MKVTAKGRLFGFEAVILACVSLMASSVWAQQLEDPEQRLNSLYASILDDYVEEGWKRGKTARFVDYRSLQSEQRWGELINLLAEFPKQALDDPRKYKAFYINAYNILSINMVLEHWPVGSLKSLGNFMNPVWTHDAGVVAGEAVTLRYLENEVLRKTGDPRIHFAINCASISCPDLRFEPYSAAQLDSQLDDQARRFLQQPNKGTVVSDSGETIHLSSIFDWFEEDFGSVGGVEAFVKKYMPEARNAEQFIADIPYDWGVNADFTGADFAQLRDDL